MYGRYTKDLGEYAKNEARKLKMLERRRKQEDKARDRVSRNRHHRFSIPTWDSQANSINSFLKIPGTIWQTVGSCGTTSSMDMEELICKTW